jgi:hypothetical protein
MKSSSVASKSIAHLVVQIRNRLLAAQAHRAVGDNAPDDLEQVVLPAPWSDVPILSPRKMVDVNSRITVCWPPPDSGNDLLSPSPTPPRWPLEPPLPPATSSFTLPKASRR